MTDTPAPPAASRILKLVAQNIRFDEAGFSEKWFNPISKTSLA
jgi:hypothetical protein